MNCLGARIRALREKKGVSSVELIRRLQIGGWDIDPAVYTRIEQGQRMLTDWEVLACLSAMGKSWADLEE